MFAEKELKLARLALNTGAPDGEWINAAVLFFKLLRGRQADPAEFEPVGADSRELVIPPTQPDYGLTIMPWGKHKGELFKDISPSYLIWALAWISEDPDRAIKMKPLAEAIERFLNN